MIRRQASATPRESSLELDALLDYLKRNRGFDFTGYKPASLVRRIQKRIEATGVADYAAYVDYLEVHPDEFAALFDAVLINVTAFFRDAPAWEELQRRVLPALLARKAPDEPIRVWSAGCASGEEAYTLAIVLAELLGADAFRERVKIYATDLDEDALSRARLAVYTEKDVAGVPADLLPKYFERVDGKWAFRSDLRRAVIFGRHDLIQHAPISRVDLLVCRNALMYLNAETQARILLRFHFALVEGGVLFLGRAETLLMQSALFTPLHLRCRIFAKAARGLARDRQLLPGQAEGDGADGVSRHVRIRDAAFDASPVAQVAVDQTGALALANERARNLFSIVPSDIGRPLQDLELSYQPVELRSLIARVNAERRTVVLKDVEWVQPGADLRSFEVQVVPLGGDGGAPAGVAVFFADITAVRRLQRELENVNEELESAYEEVQSTNEELETTNEELQSTVEELETTNEELQSTNEELETMNEELQSTNEELQAMNDEIRRRSDDLNDSNQFLESMLTSMRGAVVAVDRDLVVLVWNSRATELWGLRPAETVGRHFLNLDIGLPSEQLLPPIRACLAGEGELPPVTLPATNRRGRSIQVQVTCMPLVPATAGEPRGVILVME